jgi:hypothetical protein
MKKNLLLPATLVLLALSTPLGLADTAKTKTLTSLQVAERQLKDLSEALHRGRRASVDLIAECQRENEVMGGEIDFVGTDIIPIIPATAEGLGGAQYLPPRPKYINLHMTQLSAIMPLLQDEINGIKAPDADEATAIAPMMAEVKQVWADAQKQYAALGPLTSSLPYDTNGIVDTANALNKDLERIDKLRRDIYKSYKHDPDKGNGAPVPN